MHAWFKASSVKTLKRELLELFMTYRPQSTSDQDGLQSQMKALSLASNSELKKDGVSYEQDQLAGIREWLKTAKVKWLLVFEDCSAESAKWLSTLLPASGQGQGRVLITSQTKLHTFPSTELVGGEEGSSLQISHAVEIKPLSTADSLRLLVNMVPTIFSVEESSLNQQEVSKNALADLEKRVQDGGTGPIPSYFRENTELVLYQVDYNRLYPRVTHPGVQEFCNEMFEDIDLKKLKQRRDALKVQILGLINDGQMETGDESVVAGNLPLRVAAEKKPAENSREEQNSSEGPSADRLGASGFDISDQQSGGTVESHEGRRLKKRASSNAQDRKDISNQLEANDRAIFLKEREIAELTRPDFVKFVEIGLGNLPGSVSAVGNWMRKDDRILGTRDVLTLFYVAFHENSDRIRAFPNDASRYTTNTEDTCIAHECASCKKRPCTHAVLPCAHLALCESCQRSLKSERPQSGTAARRLHKCPVCNDPISNWVKISDASTVMNDHALKMLVQNYHRGNRGLYQTKICEHPAVGGRCQGPHGEECVWAHEPEELREANSELDMHLAKLKKRGLLKC
jgi:hypothetical protein